MQNILELSQGRWPGWTQISLNFKIYWRVVQSFLGLPNEVERVKILKFYIRLTGISNKLDRDVDIGELASLTKNFSDPALGKLVDAAHLLAIDRELKVW